MKACPAYTLFFLAVLMFVSTQALYSKYKYKENQTCVHGTYPPVKSKKVGDYVINLDLPPAERWKKLAQEKKQDIVNVLNTFKTYLSEFGEVFEELIYLLDETGPALVQVLPQPFQDELKGISDVTGIEIGEITLYNIFYEIFTLCTSIVATDKSGQQYHARNLDFGLFLGWDIVNKTWKTSEALRPSVVNLGFQKNGKTVYKTVTFAGYIGVITGMVPGKFSLTINERFNIDGGYRGIIHKIVSGEGAWMGFLTRQTLENATSYQDAVNVLSKTVLIAPVYFIVGGNTSYQGCVITRDRAVNTTNIWPMQSAAGWYILQTNYDHWAEPFFLDDRRTPGNNCMQKLSQTGVSYAGLFDVLSSQPVLNKLTVYTALMHVQSGHLETWIRYCKDPCSPW